MYLVFISLHGILLNENRFLEKAIKRGRCKIDEKFVYGATLFFRVPKQKTDSEESVIRGIIRYDQ